ncbi:hypothetical protein [Lonepinella sp. BR2271]|uniref:hypothetical protein n=1 Tax=Lonepinella sp. BR2271 TaxID=3434550 RepID=UPI003F6DD8E2
MNNTKYYVAPLLLLSLTGQVWAAETESDENWVDSSHKTVRQYLKAWSNDIDSWFGDTDPNNPSSATLRLMLDNRWNRYDGYSIKPRVRGKIKLPTLKRRWSLVFGDESIDNTMDDSVNPERKDPLQTKKLDRKSSRNDNASVALRFSKELKNWGGIDTDLDLGIRHGADIFLRAKVGKDWNWTETLSSRLEQIYRYGINSKHFLRSNFDVKHHESAQISNISSLFLEYTHDNDEETYWGNSIYRQHRFSGNRELNYGIFTGGPIIHKKADLTVYGPFISWRQPIYKQWVFLKPEAQYYNDRKAERTHFVNLFLRLEAVF